ncbi:hypothetical protein BD311DRAFT_759287 [Dichomitus squalens]|nr:hypothetical protein BD311DRAFT_759287 [Dichomitus squalens]
MSSIIIENRLTTRPSWTNGRIHSSEPTPRHYNEEATLSYDRVNALVSAWLRVRLRINDLRDAVHAPVHFTKSVRVTRL